MNYNLAWLVGHLNWGPTEKEISQSLITSEADMRWKGKRDRTDKN